MEPRADLQHETVPDKYKRTPEVPRLSIPNKTISTTSSIRVRSALCSKSPDTSDSMKSYIF